MNLPHYHHGNLKEALVHAGLDELDKKGPLEFSLRETAKRAGVSHNAPYRHFTDKSALLHEMRVKLAGQILKHMETAPLFYPMSLTLQMQFIGRYFLDIAIQNPNRIKLLFSDEGMDGQQATTLAFLSCLNSLMEQGQSSGLIEIGRADDLAETIYTSIIGFCLLSCQQNRYGQDHRHQDSYLYTKLDRIIENILHGFVTPD